MRDIALALWFVTSIVLTAAPGAAQTTTKRTAEQRQALLEAHKGDFDYLLGDWEYTAESKDFGKYHGIWSAVRTDGGQILDEYRVLGDKGETLYMTSSLRNYNSLLDRWELVGVDDGNGINDIGTARRVGDEMHIEQRFGVMSDTPSLWRIRYYNIRPDRFSRTADRSKDNGKTWETKHMTIEARRIGPARPLDPLARSKPSMTQAGSPADPISGEWGMDGLPFLKLQFDGNQTVTGTTIWRMSPTEYTTAAIAKGTFDPKTGTIRLEGEGKRPDNGKMAKYAIEGRVEGNTMSGTFTFDDNKGTFRFTKK